MASESKASSRRVQARIREAEALEQRRLGQTYRQISDKLGYRNPASAYRAVERAFARLLPIEDVEAARQIELDRLDLAVNRIMPAVNRGDLGAIDRLVKLSERRGRLAGLDKPAAVDLTSGGRALGPEPLTDAERIALLSALADRVASPPAGRDPAGEDQPVS